MPSNKTYKLITKKIYYGIECCQLDRCVLICGILVFSCKCFYACRNWIYQIKKRWEYNNEKFDGFCNGENKMGNS
jgi:hypothetical protein